MRSIGSLEIIEFAHKLGGHLLLQTFTEQSTKVWLFTTPQSSRVPEQSTQQVVKRIHFHTKSLKVGMKLQRIYSRTVLCSMYRSESVGKSP